MIEVNAEIPHQKSSREITEQLEHKEVDNYR
jgi:hypothetical protein